MSDVHRAAERAARASYGRLLAYLAARARDVAAAEDALGDAFAAALETWPRAGIPDNPDAWLLVAARRRLVDRARHGSVEASAAAALRLAAETADVNASRETIFPDERLKLLFVCAHPAIDEAVRTNGRGARRVRSGDRTQRRSGRARVSLGRDAALTESPLRAT